MTYRSVLKAAKATGLITMGAMHPAHCAAKGLTGGTLILLGAGPGFWPVFTASDEAGDDQPNPIDRWSTRVVGGLAEQFKATAHYPFGGPPYEPFIDWAQKSNRAFVSPVGMLVHDTVGLMISFRGALHFTAELDVPGPETSSPCLICVDQPCLQACPVSALSAHHPYDLNACHTFLDTNAGGECLTNGCAVRVACPVSAGAGRLSAQSALHMQAFHPK